MNRMHPRSAEAIGHALDYVPDPIRELAGCDVFCGDPVFAGLHATEDVGDGRSYRNTAHACFPEHVADRRITLVFPATPSWYVVIHELGHALDAGIRDRTGRWGPTFKPVTSYAQNDRFEAFAEAFCAWFYPPSDPAFRHDDESRAFFDLLAAA